MNENRRQFLYDAALWSGTALLYAGLGFKWFVIEPKRRQIEKIESNYIEVPALDLVVGDYQKAETYIQFGKTIFKMQMTESDSDYEPSEFVGNVNQSKNVHLSADEIIVSGAYELFKTRIDTSLGDIAKNVPTLVKLELAAGHSTIKRGETYRVPIITDYRSLEEILYSKTRQHKQKPMFVA